MSASIALSDISWSAPDGTRVLDRLTIAFGAERAGIVGRNGVGKSTLLRLIAGDVQPTGGRISIDGRIGVLRQIVDVRPDETIADLFGARAALALLAKAEAGDATVDELTEADWTIEARIEEALAAVKLAADAGTRLATLSGGQRTRAALAAAVFAEPDMLLLDEPTNHLDRYGREAVIDLLAGWRKGAIVVSHDRELLAAMDAIVELTGLGATRYGGNYDDFAERKAIELAAAEHDLATAEKRVSDVARQAQATRERQQRRDSAGARKGAKGDMPRILIGLRKDRAEGTGGGHARLAERQASDASERLGAARERIEVLEAVRVELPSTGLAPGRVVLAVEDVTGGYDPAHPILRGIGFTISGPERIAITGPNGSGKTTLIDLLTGRLKPLSGEVRRPIRMALLDQGASLLDPAISVADNFVALHPGSDANAGRAALARLGFRGDAALQLAGSLSGGQALRAALACAIGIDPPPLLILDEPTNHLDLDSIAAIEAGLRIYDSALIVVSHDTRFLDAIGITRRLVLDGEGGLRDEPVSPNSGAAR
ncbi:ABC-F family ATP-binding cassette domain-containing protein [Sphingomonas crocodyli]|uniref:ABC-F family ATP-binding cassette domain-containing protein n=1 Tax=Sphingomonas crocodyli TaxID=1979270 RepID=A0A437M0N9_9SPHN|nr:ABC-F family ATP-binding cassette domain-containing protein [Sphingomonas crocodyli]RVT91146.1 ABC-F family ATP-binding cassette domain-containing protein [Sphingomonas crocodyli]